jgi:hypothetical protein
MTAEVKPLNLIQKLASVMAAVHTIPKSGHNQFHNYDYATEADINAGVRKALAQVGVMLIPSVDKLEWREVETKSGKERIATLTVTYTATDGIEERKFTVIGEGQDRGDKATYKAMTGAGKYALLKLFLISTGDDPEQEEEEKPAQSQPRRSPKGKAAQDGPPAITPAPGVEPVTPTTTLRDEAWALAVSKHGDSATVAWWKARRASGIPDNVKNSELLQPQMAAILEELKKS